MASPHRLLIHPSVATKQPQRCRAMLTTGQHGGVHASMGWQAGSAAAAKPLVSRLTGEKSRPARCAAMMQFVTDISASEGRKGEEDERGTLAHAKEAWPEK